MTTKKATKLQLKAEARKKSSKQNREIRRGGFIPGVVYGKDIPSVLVKIESDSFRRVFTQAGEHTLVDLNLEDKDTRTVLIHDVSFDPIKGDPVHVDFYQVRLDETVKTEIPITFVGTSSAVKDKEGTLVKAMHSVEIEALPEDIPQEITIDISPLKTFEDQIMVKDIKLESEVKILADPEETVASVEAPKTEEELEELEQDVVEDVDSIEGVEKEDEEASAGEETEPKAEKETKEGTDEESKKNK